MAFLVALDIGTSTLKIGLFDEEGHLLALASRESPISREGLFVEHDPRACWNLIAEGIREVLAVAEIDPAQVKGISTASQGQTFLPVDGDGKPLMPAMVWLDQRAGEERDRITDIFGREEIYRRSGLPTLTPGNVCCLLWWLQKNRPHIFQNTYKFLHISDYIIHKFTNRFLGEIPIYSCTGLYDLTTGGWWSNMLDTIGVLPDKLPDLIQPGLEIGTLTPEAAQETGLCEETLVVSGTLDVSATALGSNTLSEKQLALNLGTTMQTNLTMEAEEIVPDQFLVWIFKHVLPHAYVGVLWRETAGLSLRWFRDHFYREEMHKTDSPGSDLYTKMIEEAAAVPPGAEGLSMLPHLQGTQIPESCPQFKGIIFGLTPLHQKAHFVRAILEGVGYSLRENIEVYSNLGWDCEEIWATGGGAKSRLWNQINADITGRPQRLVECNEASALGAAILASLGTGIHADPHDACKNMVHPAGSIEPISEHKGVYDEGYRRYKEIFQQNKTLFKTSIHEELV